MSAVEYTEALVGLLGNAMPFVRCRRVGTGGNYGVYDDCGTCPECEWRKAVVAAVPSLGPDPDLDILILQHRARNRYVDARSGVRDQTADNARRLQAWAARTSAEARRLYAAKYLAGDTDNSPDARSES